mgnify:CR=1 FL=1
MWRVVSRNGLIGSVIFSLIVLGSWAFYPDVWMSDLTEGAIAAPQTPLTYFIFLGVMGSIIGPSVMGSWQYASLQETTFFGRFLVAWLIATVISFADLIVVDYLVYMWIYPSFMQVEGIEPMHNYGKHFLHTLNGVLVGVPIALIAAFMTGFLKPKLK